LVNAHCHLDYTCMAGQAGGARSFPDWVKSLMALKAGWTEEDFRQSWQTGAQMLLRSGVTTVADIEARPRLLPGVLAQTPLRVFSFLEWIHLRDDGVADEGWEGLATAIQSCDGQKGWRGISPHAAYTTSKLGLTETVRRCRQQRWRLTGHVAESEAEFEMFMYRRGPLFDWLKAQRDMSDCGHGSPIQHWERCGVLGEDFLAVHANYLWQDDARRLAQHGASVVHCPRSHAFFQHRAFPGEELTAAGVNVCLGTDSLASMKPTRAKRPELSLLAEMRTFSLLSGGLLPEAIVRMATVNGARALGLGGVIGELAPGAFGDLMALPFSGPVEQAYQAVVEHEGPVKAVMIGGQWVMPS
jgi:aminodeoxyfutalosine deaminase